MTDLPELETPTAEEIAFARYGVTRYQRRNGITPVTRQPDCPKCNTTARAMERVRPLGRGGGFAGLGGGGGRGMDSQIAWEVLSGDALMPYDTRLDSPIERAFYRCYCYLALGFAPEERLPIIPQVSIGRYRVDFVVTDTAGKHLVVIECDGHDFHERNKEQAARDKSRDRELLSAGYPVMRFTGSEIFKDPAGCAEQVRGPLSDVLDRISHAGGLF